MGAGIGIAGGGNLPAAVVSASNSTNETLAPAATYTGTWEDFSAYASGSVAMTATGPVTIYFEASRDGVTAYATVALNDGTGGIIGPHMFTVTAKYYRIIIVDGGAGEDIALQTIKSPVSRIALPTSRLDQAIGSFTDVLNVRSVIVGQGLDGTFRNQVVNHDGAASVVIAGPLSAFGQVMVAEVTPVVQLQFGMGKVPDLLNEQVEGSSTISEVTQGQITVETGTTIGSHAMMNSRRRQHYRAGQGGTCEFTTRFNAASGVGTTAYAGLGDAEDALAVGERAGVPGFLHRHHGQCQILELVITAPATAPGDVTIVLNGGTPVVVTLAGTETINEVARAISLEDFQQIGDGYKVVYGGNKVHFIAYEAEPRAGANTYVDTDTTGAVAAGGVTEAVVGVTPNEDWTPMSSFSIDHIDGTGELPPYNRLNGNVWRITYQFLGFGGVELEYKSPTTLKWVVVHRVLWTNQNTATLFGQPSLPVFLAADNAGTTANVGVSAGSMMAGTQGRIERKSASVRIAASNSVSVASGVETVLLAVRLKVAANGRLNKVRAVMDGMTLSNDTNKLATFKLYAFPGLVGASVWAPLDTFLEKDVSGGTLIPGDEGKVIAEWVVSKDNSQSPPVLELALEGETGDLFVFTAEAAATEVMGVAFSGYTDL